MLSRRAFVQLIGLGAAMFALRPLSAVAATLPQASPPGFVIVNGWVLRHDDLAALPRTAGGRR